MSLAFEPSERVIRVPVKAWGPKEPLIGLLLLDTGAEGTLLSPRFLTDLGYDLASVTDTVDLFSVSGAATAPRVKVQRLEALGHRRNNFTVTAFAPHLKANVDGVLGVDFLLGRKLTIDFRLGLVTLE
ncbi:MAG: clan AA aspartic protease [Anaerolineae bacterium]|nr:clan AA aspartic protease [Anaerolineae bacterium]